MVLLAVVAILLSMFACSLPLLYTASSNLLHPGFYLDVLESEGAFESTAASLRQAAATWLPRGAPSEARQAFDAGLAAALTPSTLRELSGAVLERATGFVAGRYPDPAASLSLVEHKRTFARAALARLSPDMLRAFRQQLGVSPRVTDEKFVTGFIRLPDEVSLAELWADFPGREEVTNRLPLVRLAYGGTWAGAAILVLLILLLAGLYGGIRWTGAAVFLGAATLVVAAIFTRELRLATLGNMLQSGTAPAFLDLDIRALALAAMEALVGRLLRVAVISAGAGLVLWLVAPRLARRQPARAHREGVPG